ncbi:MAG TPA: hypothetical protein VLI05_02975 [Candidatus Saccharimonadia bacterium]|nr:hypothetical protein [Candidatus Saccharimonadia bacterium]
MERYRGYVARVPRPLAHDWLKQLPPPCVGSLVALCDYTWRPNNQTDDNRYYVSVDIGPAVYTMTARIGVGTFGVDYIVVACEYPHNQHGPAGKFLADREMIATHEDIVVEELKLSDSARAQMERLLG